MIDAWSPSLSVGDRLRACGAGAAAAAGIVAVEFVVWAVLPVLAAGEASSVFSVFGLITLLMFSTYALAVAFGAFFVGAVLVGLPVWLLMERTGRRSRLDATIAGGVLAGLAMSLLTMWTSDWSGWLAAISHFPQIALPGAAAGWTLHRVAYGKTVQP